MAKKKENSLNHNFETLKAQMQAKRKLAENRFEVSKIDEEIEKEDSKENISELSNLTEVINVVDKEKLDEEYVTLNIVEDEKRDSQDEPLGISNNCEIQDTHDDNYNSKGQQVEYVARKTGIVSDININKIVIKKIEKPEMPKRITYYLRPETIKKIDKFSKASGMGKSEFVQKILDEVLNNLEIEK